jgi:hypothetical protein
MLAFKLHIVDVDFNLHGTELFGIMYAPPTVRLWGCRIVTAK